LPLAHPRTVRNLTHCANCPMHGPDERPVCMVSGDPVVACAKHDYCEHPDGPRFGSNSRPHTFPSRGAGDRLAWFLERFGIARPAKAAIEKVTKKPCKCGERQKTLNRLLPAPASE
jgi:hypothetical protein